MARTIRQGFTLVEMLVVITIIGMLVALLIPAALGVQGAARRAVCMNNLKELTTACLKYESKYGKLPPKTYYETLPKIGGTQSKQEVGWVVTILEDLGKGELAGLFRDKKLVLPPQPFLGQSVTGGTSAQQVVSSARLTMGNSYMSQLVCPADPPTSLAGASLSYVCNSGILDDGTEPPDGLLLNDYKENGVFMNYSVNSDPTRSATSPNEKVTSAFISEHDGTSQTLLLSENVNASVWAVDQSFGSGLVQGLSLAPKEQEQGMLWSRSAIDIPGIGDTAVADPNENVYSVPPDQVGVRTPSVFTSRPSSLHGGGYNVAFCAGNVMWLSNQMDKGIYPLLLTPWGARARSYTSAQPIPQTRTGGMPAIINEVELSK